MTLPTPIPNSAINLYCLADVLGPHGQTCGCPTCCAAVGMTAVYLVETFVTGARPLGWWPKSVCSEKLALLCKERIAVGWPGYVPKEGKYGMGPGV